MANRKKEVYKPKPMTEGKRNLIQGLLQEYDIQSAEDIQDALKDLLSGTIQDMLETEMDDHLGYNRYERSGEPNYRNGTKSKTVRSKYGEFQVDVPQDRQSSFEPQVLPKRQKDISSIDDKIISMYAKGMTTRQISETIEDIYGFEVSEGMVSDITDKLLPRIEEWQNRPLSTTRLLKSSTSNFRSSSNSELFVISFVTGSYIGTVEPFSKLIPSSDNFVLIICGASWSTRNPSMTAVR